MEALENIGEKNALFKDICLASLYIILKNTMYFFVFKVEVTETRIKLLYSITNILD